VRTSCFVAIETLDQRATIVVKISIVINVDYYSKIEIDLIVDFYDKKE